MTRPGVYEAAIPIVFHCNRVPAEGFVHACALNTRMLIAEILAYHGTKADFDQFDPALSGDIGIHFGTPEQANSVIRRVWRWPGDPEYVEGGNIRPVDLDLKNPLRVYDSFSTLRMTFTRRAKQWSLETPGFLMTPDEKEALYHWAGLADKARRKAGGDWSLVMVPQNAGLNRVYEDASKRFWSIIQQSAIRQGYDGFVYSNRVEGKGDSYVVFDKANSTSDRPV